MNPRKHVLGNVKLLLVFFAFCVGLPPSLFSFVIRFPSEPLKHVLASVNTSLVFKNINAHSKIMLKAIRMRTPSFLCRTARARPQLNQSTPLACRTSAAKVQALDFKDVVQAAEARG